MSGRSVPPKTGRRFKYTAEGHAANTPIHAVLEDDIVRIDEMAESAALGVGENQPVALHDLVGATLAPDLITAIAVEHERRALARSGLPLEFEANALIVAVERLGFCRSREGKQGNEKSRDRQSWVDPESHVAFQQLGA